jgi:hypothetical protein
MYKVQGCAVFRALFDAISFQKNGIKIRSACLNQRSIFFLISPS